MAGTLTISTLSDGTNSTSSTNCIQGSAKAWVNFNGTSGSVAIRAAYNVSSITYNGTGDYTVNFTSSLADANYSLAGVSGINSATTVGNNRMIAISGNSAASCRILSIISNVGTTADMAYITASFFR